MKKNYILLIIIGAFFISCKKDAFLEVVPLDSPADVSFYSNETELKMAINACYNYIDENYVWEGDLMTDISWYRVSSPTQAVGRGEITSLTEGRINGLWIEQYRGISRCNYVLAYMSRAKANTNPEVYSRIAGEARFLRAFYYSYLIEMYGGVPLVTTPVTSQEALTYSRTPKDEIVDFLLNELDQAYEDLPLRYTPDDKAGATKGSALALKARIALFNKRYKEAAAAAKSLMDLKIYSLHNNITELFQYSGQRSNNEVILEMQFSRGTRTHAQPQSYFSRMTGGYSEKVPLQSLVDSYECTDGLTIDKSPLYDPAHPFDNRDPRLDQTIIHDGMVFGGFVFSTNPADVTTLNVTTGKQVANSDVQNAFASFSGYLWHKYADEADIANRKESVLSCILMRYAEVLLNYAEAKIELNEIDASLLDAINQVRARAYGTTVAETGKYPAIVTTNQAELRKIIRRERKVELAGEGLRLFDIRRWNIAHIVMPGTIYGRPAGDFSLMGIPVFDENGNPDYSAYRTRLKTIEDRTFNRDRDYLWPIPQKEINLNTNIVQNPNY